MTSMLLTGAGGFLGRALLPRMQELYGRVDTLGRRPESDIRVDLSHEVPALQRHYDTVLHCAGAAHFIPADDAEGEIFHQVNDGGTRRLCQALDAVGAPERFIFISSVAVYGCDEGSDIDEQHPLEGSTPYAISKINAERFLTEWCAARGVTLTILRCPLIVAHDAPGNLGSMQRAIAKGRYVYVGSGSNHKSIVTPADVCKLIELASHVGGIYNAADSSNPTLHELEDAIASELGCRIHAKMPMPLLRTAAFIGDLLGKHSPLTTRRLRKLSSTLTYSNSKACRELCWEPSDSLSNYGKKMNWATLVNDKRFGLENYHDPKKNLTRTDFRRDYDRLVFSSPFRRLQNKTQVFPLPGSIFVHNRLTHSMEVACVGKSMADNIAQALKHKHADRPTEHFDHLGDIVAAACLAHDLGNPPFGHSGERAIGTFFSEGEGMKLKPMFTPAQWADLTHFEGNANAFRLLTHQFKGRRKGGFAMTYSTLASIVKYPFESTISTKGKFGFFNTEKEDFRKVADELGMLRLSGDDEPLRYARHPLVFIVEAADDICYEVMDIEDAHKLKILSSAEVIEALLGFFDGERRAHMCEIMNAVDDPNEKVAYLRSCVVGALVEQCAQTFIAHEDEILAGTFEGASSSIYAPLEREGYERCNTLSWNKIYRSGEVVDIELAGNRIITFLLERMVGAVLEPDLNYSRLLLSKFPDQYDVNAPTQFGKIQAVLDHISAMTDVYALDLYRKLNGLSLPAV